jgi:hypothetical protein
MTSKNVVLTFILKFFFTSGLAAADTVLTPSPSARFTAITDHLRAGEVPLGFGPKSGMADDTEWWRVLSQAGPLALFNWTAGASPFRANS